MKMNFMDTETAFHIDFDIRHKHEIKLYNAFERVMSTTPRLMKDRMPQFISLLLNTQIKQLNNSKIRILAAYTTLSYTRFVSHNKKCTLILPTDWHFLSDNSLLILIRKQIFALSFILTGRMQVFLDKYSNVIVRWNDAEFILDVMEKNSQDLEWEKELQMLAPTNLTLKEQFINPMLGHIDHFLHGDMEPIYTLCHK